MTPRRQQILSTAADLFAARGFHGVSMGDIGAAVGVSGPALYKHFAGKEDILGQCLLHASDQLLTGARELLCARGARPPRGQPEAEPPPAP
ncbi:TetR/AcrR family transcriptional regulator, partial [Promicromonospora sp. NPDC060271]|uniref:TetR/AcrR family transcriptional regulator n=1 Tax=Promicromonospora sp. NPDC060271 TaxID=3347089 RepID=UPI003659678F